MRRPLVFFSAGFAAAAFSVQFLLKMPVVLAAFICAAVGIGIYAAVRGEWRSTAFLAVGILLGVIWTSVYISRVACPPPNAEERVYPAIVYARDYPIRVSNGRYSFSADVRILPESGEETRLRAIVYGTDAHRDIFPGDRLFVREAQMRELEVREGFNEISYYRTRGIDAIMYVNEAGSLYRGERIPAKFLPAVLRHEITERLSSIMDEEYAGFMSALTVGDKSMLSEALEERLSITGLSHTVAISGMHLSFLLGIILLLVGKKRAFVVAFPIMLLFSAVAGNTPSVVRSLVMNTMLLGAPLLMREADSLTSLFAALFLIVAKNPYAVGDVGMQLSFAATLGIVLFSSGMYHGIMSRFYSRGRMLSRVVRALASTGSASVGAMAFSTPFLVYYFGRISLISPVANLLGIWLVNILFFAATAVVALSFICMGAAEMLAHAVSRLCRMVCVLVERLSNIPYASVYALDVWVLCGVLGVYVFAVLVFIGAKYKKRIVYVSAMIVLMISFIMIGIGAYSPVTAEGVDVTVLDVGQGLCVMAENTCGRVVIDCGSMSGINAGDAVYSNMIKENTRDIDALIISHAHLDHMNGAKTLVSRARVKDLYMLSATGALPAVRELAKIAVECGTRVHFISEDIQLDFGGFTVDLAVCDMFRIENDFGIVSTLRSGEFSMLSTGDLSSKSEQVLAERGILSDTDVYIVGHHGSDNSSSDAMLDVITPELAIISVGGENKFGMPAQDTILGFYARSIDCLRTDKDGEIRFNSEEFIRKRSEENGGGKKKY